MDLNCFKAYDIRGRVPEQLNDDVAYKIGLAYVAKFNPKRVVVGKDIRLSSKSLTDALIEGLTDGGVDVLDIGLCGTEEVYFATFHHGFDGGIMVTASHNPMDYNGMKIVREKGIPVSIDTGLADIRDLVAKGEFVKSASKGSVEFNDDKTDYIKHLLSYISAEDCKPLKVVANPGNGCAGPVMELLEKHLPIDFIKVHYETDGTFPNGVPNPMIEENRAQTADVLLKHKADIGIAWDGDFDRCFFFDEGGRFVEGYYLVGLLAESSLAKDKGAKIIHDPRLTWSTLDIVEKSGGEAVLSKSGHAFIKEKMREVDGLYGGEMSAHHYFKKFSYCDSGMIPWLLVVELMSKKGLSLADMVDERIRMYPCSGEINVKLSDADVAISTLEEKYAKDALNVCHTDGVSIEFDAWRFNIRKSNTEPLVRLNVESRGDIGLMKSKTDEILAVLNSI